MSFSSASPLAAGSLRVGRVLFGAALRALRTALLRAATAAAIFVVAAFAVDRLVLGSADSLLGLPLGVVSVLYVVLGALAGGYVGLAASIERQTPEIVARLAGVLEPLFLRAVHELPVDEAALEPERLRALAETELRVPGRNSLFGPAMFEYAALNTLRDRVLTLADELERDPDADARAALADWLHDGMTAGVAGELEAHWRRSRLVVTALAAAAFVSLPLLALAAG